MGEDGAGEMHAQPLEIFRGFFNMIPCHPPINDKEEMINEVWS
jgi:hypothetical protein